MACGQTAQDPSPRCSRHSLRTQSSHTRGLTMWECRWRLAACCLLGAEPSRGQQFGPPWSQGVPRGRRCDGILWDFPCTIAHLTAYRGQRSVMPGARRTGAHRRPRIQHPGECEPQKDVVPRHVGIEAPLQAEDYVAVRVTWRWSCHSAFTARLPPTNRAVLPLVPRRSCPLGL
jgi:hypothetical protein